MRTAVVRKLYFLVKRYTVCNSEPNPGFAISSVPAYRSKLTSEGTSKGTKIMAKAKKHLTTGTPRIRLDVDNIAPKPSEPSLLLLRIKELDREFARQTKHLIKVAKSFKKKPTDHHD
jgi:hypothetical protein